MNPFSTWSWHVYLVRSILGQKNVPNFAIPPDTGEKMMYFDLRRDTHPSNFTKTIDSRHLWTRYKQKYFLNS
jgi:hypothetical protein